MIRILTLLLLAAFLTIPFAFADSCPYCGQEYGEGAPGGEAYIDQIRAQHEATCPARFQQQAQSAETPAYTGGGVDPQWAIQQQQWAEEQARIQQMEEERKIRERIERAARERAEEEARRLQFREERRRAISVMKGAAGNLGLKSSTGGETVELRPKGTEFFGISQRGGETQPAIQAQTVGSHQMLPSPSEAENMRRAVWLYRKAAQATSEEEAHFLAAQGDEALQGHPLRVEVPSTVQTPELTQEKLAEFKELSYTVDMNRVHLGDLARQVEVSEGKLNTLETERQALETRLKALETGGPAWIPSPAPKPAPTPAVDLEVQRRQAEEAKRKQREDLLRQLEELKRQMQENENTLKELRTHQDQAQQDLQQGQQKLDQFKQGPT